MGTHKQSTDDLKLDSIRNTRTFKPIMLTVLIHLQRFSFLMFV